LTPVETLYCVKTKTPDKAEGKSFNHARPVTSERPGAGSGLDLASRALDCEFNILNGVLSSAEWLELAGTVLTPRENAAAGPRAWR
jgi:hypothetical protein